MQDSCIEYVAQELTRLRQQTETDADDIAWAMAKLYVTSYDAMAEEIKRRGESPSPQKINRAIRAIKGYQGVGGSWLSHAKRLSEVYKDVFFGAGTKKLSYSHYKEIAVSSVSDKEFLRKWAEENRVSRELLKEKIREMTANDPSRPDFELKVSNHWKFGERNGLPDDFDGGLHPALIANIIHYYTEPGQTILDPMAGSGLTGKVLSHYQYFREAHPKQPNSGKRNLLMSDIHPQHESIVQADAIEGLPFDDSVADLVIVDPPYWKVAEGKYDTLGETVEEWRCNIRAVMNHCCRVVRTGGYITVITDDYLRKDRHEPLSAYVMIAGLSLGLIPAGTIYNAYPNFVVTMNAIQMQKAKDARLMVSEMKVLHVFQVREDD